MPTWPLALLLALPCIAAFAFNDQPSAFALADKPDSRRLFAFEDDGDHKWKRDVDGENQRFALSSRERFARSADDEAKAAKFAFAFAKRKAFAKRAEPSEFALRDEDDREFARRFARQVAEKFAKKFA